MTKNAYLLTRRHACAPPHHAPPRPPKNPTRTASRPDWARVPGVANRTQSRSRLGKTCSCHSARLEDPVKKPEPAIRKARSSRRSKPWRMVCGETWRNPVGLRPLAKPSAVAVAVGPRRQARLNWRCGLCRCRGPGWGESRTARSQARRTCLAQMATRPDSSSNFTPLDAMLPFAVGGAPYASGALRCLQAGGAKPAALWSFWRPKAQ